MIVPHAFDMVRIDARNKEITREYAQYAPRHEEDDEFESRSRSEEQLSPRDARRGSSHLSERMPCPLASSFAIKVPGERR